MDLFSWLIAAEPTNIGPHKVGLDIDVRTAIVAGRYILHYNTARPLVN